MPTLKRQARFTTRPETAPQLFCPGCDKPLVYRHTALNGESERWDFFECRTCGKFEYRHRTRKLRTA